MEKGPSLQVKDDLKKSEVSRPEIIVIVKGGIVQLVRCNQNLSVETRIVDFDDLMEEVNWDGEPGDDSDLARFLADETVILENADDYHSAKVNEAKYPFHLY